MKRYVLLCLTIMLCCFFIGGFYIIISINGVTDKLESIISFHQVEILRGNLEHDIKVVQTDLLLQDSPHIRDLELTIEHIESMERSAEICNSCHHAEQTQRKLNQLGAAAHKYMAILSRSLTLRANRQRLEHTKMEAFSRGEDLLNMVNSLSLLSAKRISERIKWIWGEITTTKQVIVTLVILGPLTILFITAFFLRRFTGSIDTLITATTNLEHGNLGYQIPPKLKDEFRVLAKSFNKMARSLEAEQHELELAQKWYQTLFEGAGEAIFILDTKAENIGQIISANQAAEALHGYSIDELHNMNILQLAPNEKMGKFKERLQEIIQGDWHQFIVNRKRKDGTIFPAELSLGQIEIDQHMYILAFSRDISDRQQAEKELLRANQMAVVGQMAVGLAHEIKNPLAGIKISIEVLADELELDPEDQDLFARVINEINRMERLLKNLLNYARPPQPQFDQVDLNQLLDQTVKNLEVTAANSAQKTISFSRDFATDLPPIEADSSQLQQVVLNIILNAIDAIQKEGKITTRTSLENEDRIKVEIADSGKGMSEATVENIFNPFFTTKSTGTGLGLSICRRLIEQHEGLITVASDPSEGTIFTITLPKAQKNRE